MYQLVIFFSTSLVLFGGLVLGVFIDYEIWVQFGPKAGGFAIFGLTLTTLGGIFCARKGQMIEGIFLIAIGMTFEIISQLDLMMHETEKTYQKQVIQKVERQNILKRAITLSENAWPPRTLSVEVIEAKIKAIRNRHFPQYGGSVWEVTKKCTKNRKFWRAWKYCNELAEYDLKYARALQIRSQDKKRDADFSRAYELIEVSRFGLAHFISRMFSSVAIIDPANIESFVTFIFVMFLHFAISLLASKTVKYGTQAFEQKFAPIDQQNSPDTNAPKLIEAHSITNSPDNQSMVFEEMLDEIFIRDTKSWMYFTDIHELHRVWASKNGYRPLTRNMLARKLGQAGFHKNNTGDRKYFGIRPKQLPS